MAEERLPHCSNCFVIVDHHKPIKTVPCNHLFCLDCLQSLSQCPFDNTPWVFQTLQDNLTLPTAIERYRTSPTSANEELLYEEINVNLVKCRLKAGSPHDRSKCRYDHPSQNVEAADGWTCPKCQVQIANDKETCVFCLTQRLDSTRIEKQKNSERKLVPRKEATEDETKQGNEKKSVEDSWYWAWFGAGAVILVGVLIVIAVKVR